MHPRHLTGATIAYHDVGVARGDAAPLLLLHGFTGTARLHLGPIIDAIGAERRVIAPDLRGYGASRPPARDFPPVFYQRVAADMCALLDALGLKDVHIAGFSDGGDSVLLMAATRPDLVRSVFAWGVCGVIAPEMVRAVERWLPVSGWAQSRAAWRNEIIEYQGAEQLEPLIEGWVGAARAILAAGGDTALGSAAQIRCPVLVVNGDGEVGNPLPAAQALAARIPHGALQIVAHSGHAIHEEQPHAFMQLLRDFLARNDP
ncbi:MAG: alpha/beta hydrolase [Chloroflexales bacterium]|nr:alpha/beta hydrolase [Chloroflexales bacterium]